MVLLPSCKIFLSNSFYSQGLGQLQVPLVALNVLQELQEQLLLQQPATRVW